MVGGWKKIFCSFVTVFLLLSTAWQTCYLRGSRNFCKAEKNLQNEQEWFVSSSFREHPYEVLEHCPRTHIHAESITEEHASRLLNHTITTSGCNLFYLVLLEQRVDFVLAAHSVCVSR